MGLPRRRAPTPEKFVGGLRAPDRWREGEMEGGREGESVLLC